MQLTLIKSDEITRLDLPEKCSGQYWVTQTESDGSRSNVISVEGLDGRWVLKSNRDVSLIDGEGEAVRQLDAEPNRFYGLLVAETGETLLLLSEPSTEDRRRFSRYVLPEVGEVAIGRAEDCAVRFSSRFVSSLHAIISVGPEAVTITDQGSANGTFVNGKRVQTAELRPGDVVAVVGLVLVMGSRFVAVNDPDGLVAVDAARLPVLEEPAVAASPDDEIEESPAGEVFFRSPRFKRDITRAAIKVDPPPQLAPPDEMPMAMVIGPAATMGLASVFVGVFAIVNVVQSGGKIMQAMPTVVMAFSMMIGMVLWPVLIRRWEKRNAIKKEAERQEKYSAYLERMRGVIDAECARQTDLLRANVVTIDDCVERIRGRELNLWERTLGHNDFAKVRLGIGDWPLDADIKHSERKFTLADDNLEDEMFDLVEAPKVLREVPVALSLREQPIVGVIGDRNATVDFVRGLVVQLAALHSYDELKFAFVFDEREAQLWDFARLLPHSWSDDRAIRFLAGDATEVKGLGAYLERELAAREEVYDEEIDEISPHYIVFALNKDLASKAEIVNALLAEKKRKGFTLVTLYDEMRHLPKECRVVIDIDDASSRVYDKDDITGAFIAFRPDIALDDDCRSLAEVLANTRLDTIESAFALPTMLTFLELFGVGKVEHLNALTRWRETNPVLSLETPVGVDTSGEPFKLDLHERYHGPHGLIAGMTGSGKSEFIMTFILSLAVNYHPDEVAFVLIDYKGGGMANSFVDLPHVAGTITNLDGAEVNRALISLQSELKRRQAVFNAASRATGVSNIDIYKYQSLYREGAVSEPLPHLLVISDEFAELKTQQPEFMSQLVSAARIGRSLGVHLILATQKPSGVVDDQIWSNSRFRICLKVQEKADSMEVIKRADAAELSVTGRFYMQVGFNELFEMGQSAWAGAPYFPADRVEKAYDDSAVLVDNLGQPVRQAKLDRRRRMVGNPPKQLDEVTSYLRALAAEEKVSVRRLWLDPMPALLTTNEVKAKYSVGAPRPGSLVALVGEVDDPANQRQVPLAVPLSEQGNAVVYGSAGSGKTTFVTTLLTSLLESYDVTQLNLYVLDFASETLQVFAEAPQVGEVLLLQDDEKVTNLFTMLVKELRRRKKLLAEAGGDYRAYAAAGGEPLPSIVTVIHNYAAFSEAYPDLGDTLNRLAREGIRFGICFVLTAAGATEVRYQTLQNFKQLFVLQFNDPLDYNAVLGKTDGVVPAATPGRGIFRSEVVFEFQTARISADKDGDIAEARARCRRLAQAWDGPKARAVPVLPRAVTPDHFAAQLAASTNGSVPVGVDTTSLEPVTLDLSRSLMTPVLSRDNDSTAFLQGLAEALGSVHGLRCTVVDPVDSFDQPGDGQYRYMGSAEVERAAGEMAADLERRQLGQGTDDDAFWLVTSIVGLLGLLSSETRARLESALAAGDARQGVRIVFAESAANAPQFAYESWAKSQLSAGDGVWLGDGMSEQYTLKPTTMTGDMYREIGPRFGWVLTKGRPRRVKTLMSPRWMSEEDDE